MNSDIVFFTVVIPLYNKEKYIKKTLESVLNQIFLNFEIVIIDDGSKDKSCEIVESINDTRIRLICQENGGPSKARNRGIKEAKGQFIAFLDADDEWLPEKLEKQYELHRNNPDIIWSCSGYKVVGGIKEKNVMFYQSGILNDAIDALVSGLSIWTSTVVVRKDIFENEILLFNEKICRSEDIEVWYKIACLYPKIGYAKFFLAKYNIGLEESLTATACNDFDFSFLSLSKRIEDVLNSISPIRKEKIKIYLKFFNLKAVINFWARTNTFVKYSKNFEAYIDRKFLNSLVFWNFLPQFMKKIFLKYWIYIHSSKKDC